MKIRTLICALSMGSTFLSQAQPLPGNQLQPKVDTRVELVCIAARLADLTGFNDNNNLSYARSIDRYFSKYANHPLVQYLRENKAKLESEYWEIPAVAVHLSPLPNLRPLMPYAATENADEWESRALFNEKFVTLFQRFYKDTKAATYFSGVSGYYSAAQNAYAKQGVLPKQAWLSKFFGMKTTEDYFPILALGMRSGAYMRVNFPNNVRNTVTIFECTAFNNMGIPTDLTRPAIPRLMVHEYIHAFTNQLVDADTGELRKYSERLLKNPDVARATQNTFYNSWNYLLYESLVRSVSIKYFVANGGIATTREKELAAQERAGFLWIRDLVSELDQYEAHRDQYPTLKKFMPRINLVFKKAAEKLGR